MEAKLKMLPTTCTSEGTLDRKSSSSLLSMAYGSRSFLVNLFTPAEEGEVNAASASSSFVTLSYSSLSTFQNI